MKFLHHFPKKQTNIQLVYNLYKISIKLEREKDVLRFVEIEIK